MDTTNDTPPDSATQSQESNSNLNVPVSGGPSRPAARDHSGLVTARGTGEGLVIRIDGRVEAASLKLALHEFVTSRRVFLEGNDVIIEWAGKLPEPNLETEVSRILSEVFSIQVKSTRLWEGTAHVKPSAEFPFHTQTAVSTSPAERLLEKPISRRPTLFDGLSIDRDLPASPNLGSGVSSTNLSASRSSSGAPEFSEVDDWDNADARMIYGTLRGGQKIESEHSVIVFGDVNFGAEIIAGGDVIVLGNLRGVAHAGAYDESGGGKVILALNMEPTQLRIGLVISRGQVSRAQSGKSLEERREEKGPELARVDGNTISVEPFFTRQGQRAPSSFVANLARKVKGRR